MKKKSLFLSRFAQCVGISGSPVDIFPHQEEGLGLRVASSHSTAGISSRTEENLDVHQQTRFCDPGVSEGNTSGGNQQVCSLSILEVSLCLHLFYSVGKFGESASSMFS